MSTVADAKAMRESIRELGARLPSFVDPGDLPALMLLLRLLHETGRRDLPLGRLFEGHVDALQIVARYADPAVARDAAASAWDGATFGVWNADLPGEPLRRDADGALDGGKSFASGAGVLSHALVTVDAEGGRQLLLVDLDRAPPVVDREWWRVLGMTRSETHIVRWTSARAGVVPIGAPGDYVREPWFSGGALRFVAVQAGGVAALCDHVRNHLVATGRVDDPHQLARMATLFSCADAAASAVRTAAEAWFDDEAARLPRVAATRVQVAAAAEEALTVAQRAVGLSGMFDAHPLSAPMSDLMVYLRQPAPDAQRMIVGRAVADGRLALRL